MKINVLVGLAVLFFVGIARESAGTLADQAKKLYFKKDLDAAEAKYTAYLEKHDWECKTEDAAKSYWCLARIYQRKGEPDKVLDYYRNALKYYKRLQGRPQSSWLYQRMLEMTAIYSNMMGACKERGMVAESRALMREADQVEERIDAMREAGILPLSQSEYYESLGYNMLTQRTRLHYYAGRFGRARSMFNNIVDEIQAQKEGPDGTVEGGYLAKIMWSSLFDLFEDAMFFERYEKALEIAERSKLIEMDRHNYGRAAQKVSFIYARSLVQGYTQGMLEEANQTIAEVREEQVLSDRLKAGIARSRLLNAAGRVDEAMDELDRVVQESRDAKLGLVLAKALVARAEICPDRADPQIGADLIEALVTYRELAYKIKEPKLYFLYGKWLSANGEFKRAIRTFEQCFDMCRDLKIPHYGLRALLGLSQVQIALQNPEALAEIWRRIDLFVATHPNLPDTVLAKLDLARRNYRQFMQESPVPEDPAVAASDPGSPNDSSATDDNLAEEAVDSEIRPLLQPKNIASRANPAEPLRARFLLFNPASTRIEGVLSAAAPGYACEWQRSEQGWRVLLTPDAQAGAARQSIEVDPMQYIRIVSECDASALQQTNTLTLTGKNSGASAKWDFGATLDERNISVVNASEMEENPFFAFPFYHDIVARDGSAFVNLSVSATLSCRIELMDDLANEIIAIDANGDGDFDDEGDDIYSDQDQNGFPDISVSENAEYGYAVLRCYVFPYDRENTEKKIEVTVAVQKQSGEWEAQAVDTLVVE